MIRCTHNIRDKSRAYLKVHLRDNRCESHTSRNAQTRPVAHSVKAKDKSSVVLENLSSDVA